MERKFKCNQTDSNWISFNKNERKQITDDENNEI